MHLKASMSIAHLPAPPVSQVEGPAPLSCCCNARLYHHVPATLGKRTTRHPARLSALMFVLLGDRISEPCAAASRFAEAQNT